MLIALLLVYFNIIIGGTLNLVVCRLFWLVVEWSSGDISDCAIVRDSSKMYSFQSSNSSTWTIWTQKLSFFFLVFFISIGITVSSVSGWTHGIHIILLHCLSYPLSKMMTCKFHLSITIYQIFLSQDMCLHWLHHRGIMRNQIIGQHIV